MFFLLAFLISCENLGFPERAYVLTVDDSIINECKVIAENNNKVLDAFNKECKKVKKGDEEYLICQYFKKIKNFQCAASSKINDEIGNIPDAQMAVFEVYTDTLEKINLNNLKKPHDVVFNFIKSDESISERRDLIKYIKDSLKKPKIQKRTSKKTKGLFSDKLSLIGNIGGKVHSLSIFDYYQSLDLEFIDSELNSDNLYLGGSISIKKDSKLIKSKQLVVDAAAHEKIFTLGSSKLVEVEQIGLDINDYYENPTIEFTNNGWSVNVKDGSDVDTYYIKYESATTLGVISESNQYVLAVQDSSVTKAKDINISVIYIDDFHFDFGDEASLLEKETIQIAKYGDWSGITEYPKIHVVYDHDEYNLVSDDSFKSSIKEGKPFKYPDTKKGPNIGMIVGIVVAVVVVIVVVVVVVIVVLRKKKQNQSNSEDENAEN